MEFTLSWTLARLEEEREGELLSAYMEMTGSITAQFLEDGYWMRGETPEQPRD